VGLWVCGSVGLWVCGSVGSAGFLCARRYLGSIQVCHLAVTVQSRSV